MASARRAQLLGATVSAMALNEGEFARELLGHEADSVRRGACQFLGRSLEASAVPALLKAMQDPAKEVREAAASALEAIRFHREQQQYWSSAQRAVDFQVDALHNLLRLAQKGKRAQQLRAVKALGTMGRVESLATLVELSGSDDQEIAAAASAAIEAIEAVRRRK